MALAAIPLFGLVGAALDYSRAASVRTSMQGALDATALMLAKNASTSSAAQIQSSATAFFNANFTRTDAISPTVTATYTQAASGSTVIITGSTSVKSDFVGLFGFSNINISTSSTTKWGQSRLRVALVLDNTGSMAQSSKLTSLKTAAHNLLTQLQTAAVNPGDVYVSIVPFGTDVNVGARATYRANPGPTGPGLEGRSVRHVQPVDLYDASHLHQRRKEVDAGQPQHLERLCHRPYPEQRRAGTPERGRHGGTRLFRGATRTRAARPR